MLDSLSLEQEILEGPISRAPRALRGRREGYCKEISTLAIERITLIRALGVGLLFVAACAAPGPRHEYELAPGRGSNPSMKTALVIPINETIEVPNGLDRGEDEIFGLVTSYLEAEGLATRTLGRREFQRAVGVAAAAAEEEMLSGESASVSEQVGFEEVVPHLLAELDESADLVVVPNMVMRTAEIKGAGTARWDGVRRRKRGTYSFSSFTGSEQAASLLILVYAKDGTQLFSGFGGLDLLFEVNVREKKQQLIEDRLQDVDNLREGVCVAFHPFFGVDRYCR